MAMIKYGTTKDAILLKIINLKVILASTIHFSVFKIIITIPNLVRQSRIPVLIFFSVAKSEKFEKKTVMGKSRQETSSPFQATQ